MEDVRFTCPHCGMILDATADDSPQDVVCAHCGGFMLIPAVDGTSQDMADPAARAGGEDELNAVRIRQLAAGRRAAYRSRSYCVIGALACFVAVVQLTWNGIALLLTYGLGPRPTAYLLAAGAAGWGALYFFRKAMELDREAKRSALPDAPDAPDFGPLGDGSQRWKDLEDVR